MSANDICDLVDITSNPIDERSIINYVSHSSVGAISLFIGTTRDHFEGKIVLQLEYEAYHSMAKKQLSDICDRVRQKWSIYKMAIVHRVGIVPVSEASIIVAVSSEHRREALEAVSYIIEAVKTSAAIWKKEIYDDGNSEWKVNKECQWAKT